MTRQSGRIAAVLIAVLIAIAPPRAAAVQRVASFGDAYVDADPADGSWAIGNDQITFRIHSTRARTLVLDGLFIAGSDDVLTAGTMPEALATIGGTVYRLGAPGSAFSVDAIDASVGSHFVSLSVRFTSETHPIVATRRYVVYPGGGGLEMWTDFETSNEGAYPVEDLNAYTLTVPQGAIEWIAGLHARTEEGGAFTKRARTLADGERLEIGSPTLSSEWVVPYFTIGNGHRRFLTGLVWSGAWRAELEAHEGAVQVTVGLPSMSATVSRDSGVEGPHAFVGVVLDTPGADIAAVTQFVYASRAGRGFPALTTFNTWFLHGTYIDERTIRTDIDYASTLGVELLQVDAGWYPAGSRDGMFDFTRGLGSWTIDRERFPLGLRVLTEHAHTRGVKLGLWVEPERVDFTTVGDDGLAEERFLAQHHGEYHPGVPNEQARDAQICLGDPAARAWVLRRLTALLDEVAPDNLKWDFNRWITCTREGHGHPADGGNYAHTRGLYEILAALRERYPDMTLENCSGGGHRIDFAMARLTDTAWMDDRTAPSSHVRYNLQGLTGAFPAPYLMSYVLSHPDEPVQGAEDIPLLVRSRMPGVVGLTTDLPSLGERELNELADQITLAKTLRPLQAGAVTYALTPQTRDAAQWTVLQQLNPATGGSILFAFSPGTHEPIRVFPRGLKSNVVYELRSADRGRLGLVNGGDLLAGGLEILDAPESGGQVLVLEPKSEVAVESVRGSF